ncbi:MAG: exo-alpha-sialidase [Nitrososphaerales archaeon]|nr:exo-alpha-sialidase [Nitrososphaerales archaeon]
MPSKYKARFVFLTTLMILTMMIVPIAPQALSSSDDALKHFSGVVGHFFSTRGFSPDITTQSLDIRVWKSTDGGLTFDASVVVAEGSRSVFHDKPWITVDSSLDSDYEGNVYVSWTRLTFGKGTEYTEIVLSRSTDGGQTWSDPISISPKFDSLSRLVQGSMPAVGPDGTVYVAYYDSLDDGWLLGDFSLMMVKSTDGGETFSIPVVMATMPEIGYDLPPTFFRAWASMFPMIAVDSIDSDYVYAVFAAYDPIFVEDIYLTRSDDGGETWDSPVLVNDDDTPNSQFFPNIAVTPDGRIHMIWGDRRDDPDNYLYNVYYDSVPFTGPFVDGLGTDELITTVSSDPTIQDIYFMGDYFDLAQTSDDEVFAVWTDMRNDGDQDIYMAGSPDFDNIRINQDAITRLGLSIQNEPTIAVNPEDPTNIVVGAHDYRNRFVEAWYYTSVDGGSTWVEGPLPGVESIYLTGDPTLAFGLDDTVYFSTIATELVSMEIEPDSGAIGTSVESTVAGFDPFSEVLIMFDDETIGFVTTDAVGMAEVRFTVSLSEYGAHIIKATDGNVWVEEPFTMVDDTPILIDVESGSNLFRGETASIYAKTSLHGQPINATSLSARIYLPDDSSANLMIQQIDDGLYMASYPIPGDAPFGTYLVVFDAQIINSTIDATGSATSGFVISHILTDRLSEMTIFQYLIIIILALIALVEGIAIFFLSRIRFLVRE